MLNLSSIKPSILFPRAPHAPRGSFCSTPDWSLVNHPFRNVLISVDPAVAQERPVRALRVDLAEIAFGHQDGLFRDAGLRDDLPRRVGDEALSPELNAAMWISVRRRLMSDAVGDRDINPVGDGVRALDYLP